LWKFVDSTPLIEISIENTLLKETYPGVERGVMAVLDTGYTGFLFVPRKLFKKLRLDELKAKKIEATMADGSHTIFVGALGSITVPELGVKMDGVIETTDGATEILIGMEGVRRLLIELDYCRKQLTAQDCSRIAMS
jgi:clan AA aspartic protease